MNVHKCKKMPKKEIIKYNIMLSLCVVGLSRCVVGLVLRVVGLSLVVVGRALDVK